MPPTWVPPAAGSVLVICSRSGRTIRVARWPASMPSMLQPAASLVPSAVTVASEPERVSTVQGHRLVWPMKPATNTVAGLS